MALQHEPLGAERQTGDSVSNGMTVPKVGVLALQGDFAAHCRALHEAGAEAQEVRTAEELAQVDALVLPGGESTTMLRLLDLENLFEPLREFGRRRPIFGTCAGAILLASEVANPNQRSLGLMDIAVERNAYGRQVDSRIATIALAGEPAEAVFIRAPVIRRVGAKARVLATYSGHPVLVADGMHLAATFHPELRAGEARHGGSTLHRYFVRHTISQTPVEYALPSTMAK